MLALSREHEEATIRAFVVKSKQERFLSFLASPRGRAKFTNELGHFRWFEPKYATPVSWKVDPKLGLYARHTQGIGNITSLLKAKGARSTCWAISDTKEFDMQELVLESALESIVGGGSGTILSCIPGRLAFFNGEEESLLLER
jgi:hypothetical protein